MSPTVSRKLLATDDVTSITPINPGCGSAHDGGDFCKVSGDPHFCTWDAVKHHYQGDAGQGYYYVDGCDPEKNTRDDTDGLPFDVIGIHKDCNNGLKCLDYIAVRFYTASGDLYESLYMLVSDTDGDDAANLLMIRANNINIAVQTGGAGTTVGGAISNFITYDCTNDGDSTLRLRLKYENYGILSTSADCTGCADYHLIVELIRVNSNSNKARIYLSKSFNARAFGLCGTNNGVAEDDVNLRAVGVTLPSRRLLQASIVYYDPAGMQNVGSIRERMDAGDEVWERTRDFGDAWRVNDPNYVNNDPLPPFPSTDCINAARTYCTQLWEDETATDCGVCETFAANPRFDLIFESWLEDCIFDACTAATAGGDNLEDISLSQALISGYFGMPIGDCQVSCETRPGDCSDWTSWMDRDNPSATGDWERIIDFELDGGSICNGGRPSGIECRSVNGGIDYADYEFDENIETRYCVADTGFLCVNGDGSCPDFEVRFCCGEYIRDTSPYFECPDICTDLTSQNGCAGDQCLETCRDCITGIDYWDHQGGQNPNCRCHNAGCNECPIGWFKVHYDYPCQPCSAMEGCSHCSDFHGCQQCQQGYVMVQDYECGQESHHNTNPINYCVPM